MKAIYLIILFLIILIHLGYIVWYQDNKIQYVERRLSYKIEDLIDCQNAICSDHGRFDSCNGERCILVTPKEYPDYYCQTCNEYTCK